MEYLKAFIIGTSGLVILPSLSEVAIDEKYNYDAKYSFIIPIYYGLMTIFSVFIGKTFNLSLKLRLFIASIISSILVILFNYNIDKYKNYYEENKQNVAFIVIKDIFSQLIIFNVIIFYLSFYFSKYWLLKLLVIGSSAIHYYQSYIKVYLSKKKNYDFKYYAITEPLGMGITLAIWIYIGINVLKLKLIPSLISYYIITPFIMVLIAYKLKLYQFNEYYSGNIDYAFWMIISGLLLKFFPVYYLNKYLK